MKKILLFIFLMASSFAFEVYTNNEHTEFIKSLKLSNKQSVKIEKIEQDYSGKISKLNAEILLKEMQIAQLRVNQKNESKIYLINCEIKSLKSELYEILVQKDKEILSNLNFIQKIKYKKHNSKAY